MTSEEVRMLFAYNSWATNRVFESLSGVPEDVYTKDMKAGHSGIHGTLTHLVAAEKLWLSRLTGKPESSMLKAQEVPSLGELKQAWEDVASRTARFVAKLEDATLPSRFEFSGTEGKTYSQTYQQALQHLLNHSTYHRGQIAVLMRQAGIKPIGTDLIAFYRHAAQPVPKQ